jgi:hypothetical protein
MNTRTCLLSTILSVLSLSGCVHTVPLPTPAVLPKSLPGVLPTNAIYSVQFASDADFDGTQFLLFILPFGTTSAEHAPQELSNRIAEQLILNGIHYSNAHSAPPPILKVSILSVSMTAYDLLLTRRLVSRVEISTNIQPAPEAIPLTAQYTFSRAIFSPFPTRAIFEQELTLLMQSAAIEIVQSNLYALIKLRTPNK